MAHADSKRSQFHVGHVTLNMDVGGAEAVLVRLVRSLRDRDIGSCVYCVDGHVGAFGRQLQEEGVPIVTIGRRPGFDPSTVRGLRHRFREYSIDLVHCHQYTPWVYGTLAAIGTGSPVVFTEHGRLHPDRTRLRRRLANQLLRLRTASVTAISEATADALVEKEWLLRSDIDVIYNGVEDPAQAIADRPRDRTPDDNRDTFVVGTVARLHPVKNHDSMLQAVASVAADVPALRLLIVGDGPERERLEALARELGIDRLSTFVGYRPDPFSLLSHMDVFLLTSHTEGTSMTLIEAMALGKPCVVSDVGGNPEVVEHGNAGLLCPPDQPEAFADAIRSLYWSVAERERLGRRARAVYEARFSLHRMTGAYVELYRGLSSNRRVRDN